MAATTNTFYLHNNSTGWRELTGVVCQPVSCSTLTVMVMLNGSLNVRWFPIQHCFHHLLFPKPYAIPCAGLCCEPTSLSRPGLFACVRFCHSDMERDYLIWQHGVECIVCGGSRFTGLMYWWDAATMDQAHRSFPETRTGRHHGFLPLFP